MERTAYTICRAPPGRIEAQPQNVRSVFGVRYLMTMAVLLALATITFVAHAQSLAPPAREEVGVQAVLDRATEAMGGGDQLFKATTLVVTGTTSRATAAGMVRSATKTYFRYPMSVRSETTIGGATVALVSTQEGATMISEEGAVDLPDSARHHIERTAMRNPFTLLKSRHGRFFSGRSVGEARVDGATADLVEITIGRNKTTIAVDRVTGRLLRQSYQSESETDDKQITIVVAYSDYRPLEGRGSYPFRARGTIGERVVFVSEVERMDFNVPIDASLFAVGAGQASAGARVLPR